MNLGAILFAKQLKDFPTLRGKEIIVKLYINQEDHGVGPSDYFSN